MATYRPAGSAHRVSLSRKLLLAGLASGLFVVVCEIALRAVGWGPYRLAVAPPRVDPGGRLYQRDDTCGHRYIPGRHTVTLPSGYAFHVSIKPDGLRATGLEDLSGGVEEPGRGNPQLWIFGCSFTFGWSVNDEETYCWLLQTRYPGWKVLNFGVDGYGTVHSLMQLRQALSRRPAPAVVVLAYGDFHDLRSMQTRMQRRNLVGVGQLAGLREPHAWLDATGALQIDYHVSNFRAWPLARYSAVVHTLERQMDRIELAQLPLAEVSRQLIAAFRDECERHEVRFMLAGLGTPQGTAPVLDFFSRQGVATANLLVDLRPTGMTNAPHDMHPSANAHREYAERLGAALDRLNLGEIVAARSGTNLPVNVSPTPRGEERVKH